jgi:hypothetical protein
VRTGLGLDAASGPLEALAAAPLANGRGQAVGRLEAVVDTGR